MELTGKGYYLWQIKRAFGGDPAKIADAAKQAGLSHVLIKVADGVYNYNITDGVDLVPGLVAALRSRGISPWGWQYIYGVNASNEAKRAITRVKQLGLDGFVVNAEKEFKAPNMAAVAKAYMQELRAGLPQFPIGLSTYRYPKLHAPFPFTAFLEFCNLNFPQIYWVGSSNPAQQLKRSIDEYKELTPVLPVIPTGAAYGEGSWSPTPSQVIEFLEAAKSSGLKAANFWEWQTAYVKTELWSAISHFDWAAATPPAPVPPPTPPVKEPEPTPTPPVKPPAPTPVRSPQAQQALDIGNRLIAAFNSGSANQIVFLYESDGRLICNGQGRSGSRELYSWYSGLLRDTFPKAKFRLLDAGTQADFLKLVWSATLANGNTARGTDLIRMDRTGKLIAVHHAAFSLSRSAERALA
ncbi:MAG: hypothetical protein KIS88_04065 [Anaerolineales bacterium]|nr:hypothetical protein [Anaerolineales bacterium]